VLSERAVGERLVPAARELRAEQLGDARQLVGGDRDPHSREYRRSPKTAGLRARLARQGSEDAP
jgi:hypothetical protein